MNKGIYINDSIHGLILLSEYERRIISSIGFNRLHDVYQNSTVYLTFPTNRTKRFEHSIGTMKLCSDILYYSILNSSPEVLKRFYSIFTEEINNIILEISKDTNICEQKLGGVRPRTIPKIKFDNLRNSITPCNVIQKNRVIHVILMEAIRAAALLHDIGHPPFSHIVEFALKAVFIENKNNSENNRVQNFISTMAPYFEGKNKLHEQMGNEISESILKGVISAISDEDERYEENLFEVIILKCVIKIFGEKGYFSDLHRIIDSSLDGDRLDYVTRDSVNSGFDSGKIDYKRIINDMQMKIDENHIYFCVPLKAINSVEDFVKRRYNIYKDIIYHHRVIKTDYLLEYAVRALVEKYINEGGEQSEALSNMVIPFDISGLWFPLGNATVLEKSNALSQWNDSWLMTILRQIYYTEYYRNKEIKKGTKDYVISQQLSELLRNKKCYYSLIKRSENFKIIDDVVKEKVIESKDSLISLMDNVNSESLKNTKSPPKEGAVIDIRGTLDCINNIIDSALRPRKGFIISYISRHISAIRMLDFKEKIIDIVKKEAEKIFNGMQADVPVVVFKNISIGLDKPIYFYDASNKIYTMDEVSGISDILRLDSDYLPVFYVYILLKDSDDIVKEKREVLLKNIGKAIGNTLIEHITDVLNEQIKTMED